MSSSQWVVTRFDLPYSTKRVTVPLGSRFLCLDKNQDAPCLWFAVPRFTVDGEDQVREYLIVQNQGVIDHGNLYQGKYLGKVSIRGGVVHLHVWEVTKE